jgi:hypothetical protein
MTTIKFSATATVSAATSITVPFGGSPAVGDLVVVFLLVDSEIITHQPGWATEFTANPNPWFKMEGLRSPDNATLSGWYHTWNASDSGTSAVFTFVPAPTLGIGDKDLPTANAVAIAAVFDGANATAVLEHNGYGSAQDLVSTIPASPLKLASNMALHAVGANGSTASLTDSDSLATLVQSVTLASPAGMTLALFKRVNSPAGYRPSFTLAASSKSLMVQAMSVSDNLPQIYNGPFIEEAPMGMNALMARYRMNRYFTVLNNGGTFSAQRYQSTDQISAATQVFVNNQPISATDRTNLLNAGVGGDFAAIS